MRRCPRIRQFNAVFGETPHQFRTRARLESAKLLLALSDRSVTDVCMDVGFTSLGSFSDLFTRRVGAAPSAYRRQIRSTIQVPEALAPELFPGCLTLMSRLPAHCAIFEKHPGRDPVRLNHDIAGTARSDGDFADGHPLTAREHR